MFRVPGPHRADFEGFVKDLLFNEFLTKISDLVRFVRSVGPSIRKLYYFGANFSTRE